MYKMSLSCLGEPEVGGSIDGYLRSLTAQEVTAQGPMGIIATQTFLDAPTGATKITLARVDNTTDESGNIISLYKNTTDYKIGSNTTGFGGNAYTDMRYIYPQGEGIFWAWSIANSALSGRPVGQVDFSQIPSVNGQPLSGGVAPISITNNAVAFSAPVGGGITYVQNIDSPQPRSVWKVQMLFRGGSYTNPGTAATIQYFLRLPTDPFGPIVSQTLDAYQTDCINGASNNMLTSVYLTLVLPTPVTTITLWAAASAATNLSGSSLYLFVLP